MIDKHSVEWLQNERRMSAEVAKTLENKGFWQVLHFGNEYTVST